MRVDEFLARLANVKRSGAGHTARCPSHEDRQNSLSVSQGDSGKLLVKCFAGCSIENICAALSLDVKDLFADAVPKRKKREPAAAKPPTVAELAAAKQLPEEFLREQGIEDFPDGSGVAIPYFEMDGSQAVRLRKRTALRAKDGSSWIGQSGVQPIPYGLWKLSEWR